GWGGRGRGAGGGWGGGGGGGGGRGGVGGAGGGGGGVGSGFVQQPHRFHQELGGVFCRRGALGGVGCVKVDFKISGGPQHDFVDRVIAFYFAHLRIAALATGKIELPLHSVIAHREPAGLLAHFERLHQVDHAHLFQPALNHTRTRSAFLQLLEVQAIDHFFRDSDQVFNQKRLGDEVFHAIHQRPQALLDVRAAGHEQKRNVPCGIARAQLFEKLPAVQHGHLVIAKNDVWRGVDDL